MEIDGEQWHAYVNAADHHYVSGLALGKSGVSAHGGESTIDPQALDMLVAQAKRSAFGVLAVSAALRRLHRGYLVPLGIRYVTFKGVTLRTWDRVKLFIKEAGRVIVIMVLVINTLNSIGTDGSFGNEDTDRSVLSAVSKAITPVLAPLGIHQENWPATVGIFTGILAKETVVGTLDALYTNLAQADITMPAIAIRACTGLPTS
ncbi:MAG: nucleoside recognition domain-containing protein [Novosphingobium sp.]